MLDYYENLMNQTGSLDNMSSKIQDKFAQDIQILRS